MCDIVISELDHLYEKTNSFRYSRNATDNARSAFVLKKAFETWPSGRLRMAETALPAQALTCASALERDRVSGGPNLSDESPPDILVLSAEIPCAVSKHQSAALIL